jgi:hypothetical protein
MYVLANLAMGNQDTNFMPIRTETTPLPGYFEIDYIRVHAAS